MPTSELIAAYASFGIAFVARPFGGAIFGHFGDKIGRKTTLGASLAMMGISTAAIGFLPTFAVAGWLAPALLCMLRLGQGLALGGEWTGATLLALENAPVGWRARYGMFAPLGAPIGFILANGLFLALTMELTPQQFMGWGWRVPFLASAPLVLMGLWVRFSLVETKEFTEALKEASPHRIPILQLVRQNLEQVVAGTFGVVACFSLYWITTAFSLGYGTTVLGYTRSSFLLVELVAILFMAGGIILASWLSDRVEPSRVLITGCVGTIVSGMLIAPAFGSGSLMVIFIFLAFSLLVMGFVNGPLGAWLPSLFPARVRYSGASLAFNIGGLLGGAFSPMIGQALASESGLPAVGFYLALTGGVSLMAFDISSRRQARDALVHSEKRYRSIFEQTYISLCELNFSKIERYLRSLELSGVNLIHTRKQLLSDRADEMSQLIEIHEANDATIRLLGARQAADIVGPLGRFLCSPDAVLSQLLLLCLEGGGRFEEQISITALDGQKRTILLVAGVPGVDAALERVTCAMIDITERRRAHETLQAAQAELARAGRISMVGAVSASIAHEVNQPIGAMVMSAQACVRWLAHNPPNLDAATRAAERSVREGMRASEIVQRTREQVRKDRPTRDLLNLEDLITGALSLLESETRLSGTTITVDSVIETPSILGDRIQIQQVIVNLVTNAMHAMKKNDFGERRISIRIRPDQENHLVLSVRDSGSGMDPIDLPRLFNPFFSTKSEGMGVGLAICKTIVESHGGEISARNNTTVGATFEVRFPSA